MLLKKIKIRILSLFVFILIAAIHGYGQKDYKIKKVSVVGNKTLKDADVKEQMNTKDKTLIGKLKFWVKAPRFSPTMFEDDIQRLIKYYQRNGFLAPKIDYTFRQNEESKSLKIVVKVIEGEPVTINKIDFEILSDAENLPSTEGKKKEIPTREGDRFQDENIKLYDAFLQKKYANGGYPFSQIENQVTILPGNKEADINFRINPGMKSYFGPTFIKSDSLVPVSFIRNRLRYNEGEPYSKSLIEKSQEKLYDTDLFQFVVIRTLLDSLKGDKVPMTVNLKEKPRWLLEFGAGYGSEDRLRLSTQITRRQFFGGARKFIFSGKTSYTLPVSLEFRFIQPDFLADNLDLIINPFYIKENETSYKVERLGGGTTFQYNFSRYTTAYLMYSFERTRFTFKTGVQDVSKQDSLRYNKSGFTLGFTRNTTTDLFNPSSGIRVNNYLTLMGVGLNSRYHYVKLEMEFRKYFSLPNEWVWASKVRVGGMKPIMGDEFTPIEDRFMLGGALSLRGWGRNKVSPVNEFGALIGGNSMFEASTEFRFPIYNIFSGAFFMDAGNVWKDSRIPDLTDLLYDIGTGLRVSTPIGPVRFDIATPIFDGKFKGLFFVSIGHAF